MNKYKAIIAKIFDTACAEFKLTGVNANVYFVPAKEIKKLNRIHRKTDAPTDVLSFPTLNIEAGQIPTTAQHPHDINHETGAVELGEIVICEKIARSQARTYGHSLEREIAFLYLHGLLHLLGYDHETPQEEEQMNELSETVLKKAGYERLTSKN